MSCWNAKGQSDKISLSVIERQMEQLREKRKA